jgi:hypothetical protein
VDYGRCGGEATNVTRHSGYLETVTIYFEGQERQIMGSVEGFGRGKQDFHRYDDRQYNPGSKTTLQIDKQVEFNDFEGRRCRPPYRRRGPGRGRWTALGVAHGRS